MKKLTSLKTFVAKNKPLVAVVIVATATVAAIAIDVVMRDEPFELETLTEAE